MRIRPADSCRILHFILSPRIKSGSPEPAHTPASLFLLCCFRLSTFAFCLFTGIGALAWNLVLALLGYLAHLAGDISVVEKYSHEISVAIVLLLVVVVAFFVVRWIVKKNKKS